MKLNTWKKHRLIDWSIRYIHNKGYQIFYRDKPFCLNVPALYFKKDKHYFIYATNRDAFEGIRYLSGMTKFPKFSSKNKIIK